jgi:hypothetical protein
MAAPLPSRKNTVDLTARGVRVSRIRRDPPPKPVKELTREQIRARELRAMVIGITALTFSLLVVFWQLAQLSGWQPAPITIVL